MPIQLPPVSRRRFLTRFLAAGAGVAVAPALFATEGTTDDSLWALLSDTHIAADQSKVSRGVNMAEHLAKVVEEVTGLVRQPAGIFVAGDCAFNSGQKDDYATMAGLLRPGRLAGVPVHLALGNHDNRERFWEALPEERATKRPLEDRQVALVRSRLANWFMLDSLEETLLVPGLIGQEQLDWLSASLDEETDKPALVMAHHNPTRSDNIEGLKDTDALFRVLRPRKQVKAYLFGHTHRWSVSRDESGIHLINLPPVAYVFHEGNPTGWVQAKCQKEGMRLELRCVDPRHPAHGEVVDLTWRT